MAINKLSSSRKPLKICCTITAIFLTIFVVISVILYFTIFKPKQPRVTAHPPSLENLRFQISPPRLNVTLGITVTIENRNYGSFEYKNSTGDISYHGTNVAEFPIEHQTVPARGKLNITTYANVTADKFVSSPYFGGDLLAGRLDLSSITVLRGKVRVIAIVKIDVTVYSKCNISILIQSLSLESNCHAKIKLG